MMTDLSTSASAVQLSLSAFLVGAAVGQLVFGPLSDRVGRRGPLLIGLTLYVVFGVAATFATSATMLIVLRVLQGLSGAAASVLSRTIVTDRLSGLAATRTLNVLMAMAGIAPAIAPVLGGLLAPLHRLAGGAAGGGGRHRPGHPDPDRGDPAGEPPPPPRPAADPQPVRTVAGRHWRTGASSPTP